MMGCRAAVPAAAREHRTILPDAAAVEDLPGFRSVFNVPKAYVGSAQTGLFRGTKMRKLTTNPADKANPRTPCKTNAIAGCWPKNERVVYSQDAGMSVSRTHRCCVDCPAVSRHSSRRGDDEVEHAAQPRQLDRKVINQFVPDFVEVIPVGSCDLYVLEIKDLS